MITFRKTDLERWRLLEAGCSERRVGNAHCRLALLQLRLERRGLAITLRNVNIMVTLTLRNNF